MERSSLPRMVMSEKEGSLKRLSEGGGVRRSLVIMFVVWIGVHWVRQTWRPFHQPCRWDSCLLGGDPGLRIDRMGEGGVNWRLVRGRLWDLTEFPTVE